MGVCARAADEVATINAIRIAVETLTLNLASSVRGAGDTTTLRIIWWTTILTKER
jgi:hypothetical protein